MAIPEELQEIITDADDNFQNGRFQDAYAHYDTISLKCIQQGDIEHALYYTYKALLCLDRNDQEFLRSKTSIKLGVTLLKSGLNQLSQLLNTLQDPWDKLNILLTKYDAIEQVDFTDSRSNLERMIINNYRVTIDEHDLSVRERILQLEKLLAFVERSSTSEDYLDQKLRLSQLLNDEADKITSDEINIYRKIQLLNQSADLLPQDSEKKDQLQKRIIELEGLID